MTLQKRMYLIAAIILLTGLGSAAVIYMLAGNASENLLVINMGNSKKYIHDLELYGGKMNVLVDQFCRWFEGLWHGKSLASTIAVLTTVISVILSLLAYYLPQDPEIGKAHQSPTVSEKVRN